MVPPDGENCEIGTIVVAADLPAVPGETKILTLCTRPYLKVGKNGGRDSLKNKRQ